MDTGVGRLLDYLRMRGLDTSTYVFLTSDNGAALPYGKLAGSNGVLRCGKGTTWEGGVRVPFIAWGADVTRGAVTDVLATGVDLFATMSTLAGLAEADAVPRDRVMDSIDFSPALRRLAPGSWSPRSAYVMYALAKPVVAAVRVGPFKVHFHTSNWQEQMDPTLCTSCAFPPGHSPGFQKRPLVFDVARDPGEHHTLPLWNRSVVAAVTMAREVIASVRCGEHGAASSCNRSAVVACSVHYRVDPWPPKPFRPWAQDATRGIQCCAEGHDAVLPLPASLSGHAHYAKGRCASGGATAPAAASRPPTGGDAVTTAVWG